MYVYCNYKERNRPHSCLIYYSFATSIEITMTFMYVYLFTAFCCKGGWLFLLGFVIAVENYS